MSDRSCVLQWTSPKRIATINHPLLLEELSNLGTDFSARAWFTLFLTNRKQVTSCSDVCSEAGPIPIGVAQGSILGPLLFVMFTNDLPDVLQYCQVTLYADDTALYFASKSVLDLESKINADLGRVCKGLITYT